MKLNLFGLFLVLVAQNSFAATATYQCTVNNSESSDSSDMVIASNALVPADGILHFLKTNHSEYTIAVSIREMKDNPTFVGYSNVIAYYNVDSSTNVVTNLLPALGGTIKTGEAKFNFQSIGKDFGKGKGAFENIYCELK